MEQEKKILTRIQNLVDEIRELRYRYHVINDPTVTDEVYDSLRKELDALLKQYPKYESMKDELDRVAGKPLDVFEKVTHRSRMLSLNDAFSIDEIREWMTRIRKIIPDARFEYLPNLSSMDLQFRLCMKMVYLYEVQHVVADLLVKILQRISR